MSSPGAAPIRDFQHISLKIIMSTKSTCNGLHACSPFLERLTCIFKSVSISAPGKSATCHLTDFNETLPV